MFRLSVENERDDVKRDDRARLASPTFQARTGIIGHISSVDTPLPEGRPRVLGNMMYKAYYINSAILKGKHSGRP